MVRVGTWRRCQIHIFLSFRPLAAAISVQQAGVRRQRADESSGRSVDHAYRSPELCAAVKAPGRTADWDPPSRDRFLGGSGTTCCFCPEPGVK